MQNCVLILIDLFAYVMRINATKQKKLFLMRIDMNKLVNCLQLLVTRDCNIVLYGWERCTQREKKVYGASENICNKFMLFGRMLGARQVGNSNFYRKKFVFIAS